MGDQETLPKYSAIAHLQLRVRVLALLAVLSGLHVSGLGAGSTLGAEPKIGKPAVPALRRLPPTQTPVEPRLSREFERARDVPAVLPAEYQRPVGEKSRVVGVGAEELIAPPVAVGPVGPAVLVGPAGDGRTYGPPERLEPPEIVLWPPDSSIAYELQDAHVIHVGDQLELTFPFRPSFNQQLTVRDDGIIAPLLLHPIMAAGRSPEGVEAQLRAMYQGVTYDARANRQNSLSREYLLQVGDELEIRFAVATELNDRTTVRPDGRITLSRVGQVLAEGQTVEDLEQALTDLYKPHVPRPNLVVIVRKFADNQVYVNGVARSVGFSGLDGLSVRIVRQAPRLVYVTGEVGNPAAIPFLPGMTALRAIITAGGFKRSSAMHRVVIVRRVSPEDSMELKVNLQRPTLGNKLWCKDGEYMDAPLRPDDVLVVPKTSVAKLRDILDQYVYDLFPTTRNAQVVMFYDLRGGQNANAGAVLP